MKYSLSITQPHYSFNGEICNKSYLAHRPWSALPAPTVCASPKESTMTNPDQLSLALQTACLIQQNQMLKQQNVMPPMASPNSPTCGHPKFPQARPVGL